MNAVSAKFEYMRIHYRVQGFGRTRVQRSNASADIGTILGVLYSGLADLRDNTLNSLMGYLDPERSPRP